MNTRHTLFVLIILFLAAFYNTGDVSAAAKTYTIGVGEKLKLSKSIMTTSGDASAEASSDAGVVYASGNAVKGLKVGSTRLTLADGTTIKIKVRKAPAKLTLKSSDKYLFTNDTATLKVTLNKMSASHKITFSTSNKKVATVSKSGTIKAGKKGTVRITAKAYNGVKASIKLQVKSASKLICLTFDDGPSGYTPKLLKALKKYNYHGTFFMVGVEAQGKKGTIKIMKANGNELGMHSWHHDYLTRMSKEQVENDIKKTRNLIKSYTGVSPKLFRPPYGAANDTVYAAFKSQGCPCIMWNINVKDYETTSSEVVYNNIKKTVHPGAVLVIHDSHSWSVDGLIKALPWLKSQGYELVTVSEFARLKGIKLEPGKKYVGTAR